MRIVFFSNWFPPVVSGSSYYTSSLAHALHERGHDVVVVTLDWGPESSGGPEPPFRVERLKVLRVPRLSIFYNLRLMGFAFTPRNRKRLVEILSQQGADILHHVNHIFDTAFLTVSAARRAGIPIVGSVTTLVQHPNRFRQRLMQAGDRHVLGRFGVMRWDGIVSLDSVTHAYVGEVFGRDTQRRSVVVPFGARSELMPLYRESEPKAATPQILMTGHIHPFRNPVKLIRAMPLILKEVPDARLVLAGRVDLDEPVRAARELGLIPRSIEFLGAVPHEKVVHLMKTSHVFASWVTGPYHGLGTAPIEAMLCGTPVVNDFDENLFGEGTLRNGDNILLLDSLDPAAIARGILSLLKDEGERARMGEAGRKFVLDHLSWDKIAERVERLYDTVTAERRRRVSP